MNESVSKVRLPSFWRAPGKSNSCSLQSLYSSDAPVSGSTALLGSSHAPPAQYRTRSAPLGTRTCSLDTTRCDLRTCRERVDQMSSTTIHMARFLHSIRINQVCKAQNYTWNQTLLHVLQRASWNHRGSSVQVTAPRALSCGLHANQRVYSQQMSR